MRKEQSFITSNIYIQNRIDVGSKEVLTQLSKHFPYIATNGKYM